MCITLVCLRGTVSRGGIVTLKATGELQPRRGELGEHIEEEKLALPLNLPDALISVVLVTIFWLIIVGDLRSDKSTTIKKDKMEVQ